MALEFGQRPGGNAPWGQIDAAPTQYSDAVAQQLLSQGGALQLEAAKAADKKQEEARAQKQRASDAEEAQSKEIDAKVRAADVPAIHSAYNDYRQKAQDLIKNQKNMPREDYLKAQQDVNNSYANAQQQIAASSQRKTVEQETLKDMADPNNVNKYNPNAIKLMNASIGTPISQLGNYQPVGDDNKPVLDTNGKPTTLDLKDPSNYLYKSTTNFDDIYNGAMGKQGKLNSGVPMGNQSGITTHNVDYEGTAAPAQFGTNLITSLTGNDEKGKIPAEKVMADFKYHTSNVTPDMITQSNKDYQEKVLNNPAYQQAYEAALNQAIPKTGNPEVDAKVNYVTQQYAITHPPVSKINQVTNAAAKDEADHNFDIYKINYQHALKKGDEAKAGKGIEDNFNVMYAGNGTTATTTVTNPTTGEQTKEERKPISAPLSFRKAFSVPITGKDGKPTEIVPDQIVKLPNGNLKGLYYQRDDSGNIVNAGTSGSQPERLDVTPVEMNPNTAKLAFAKAIGGEKAVAGVAKTLSSSSNKVYKLNNKSFSQDAVDKAAKASGMTTEQYIKKVGFK